MTAFVDRLTGYALIVLPLVLIGTVLMGRPHVGLVTALAVYPFVVFSTVRRMWKLNEQRRRLDRGSSR